jgi:hypothetical protein
LLAAGVSLLDLSGLWPTRAGTSQVISSGTKARAQRWARAIYEAFPGVLAGIHYRSSMHGGDDAFALFETAIPAIPAMPIFDHPLSSPGLDSALVRVTADLGYRLLI